MIINELRSCPTRPDYVFFTNDEQTSLAFTDAFCFAHAKNNLIELNLHNNCSAHAVNNISDSAL